VSGAFIADVDMAARVPMQLLGIGIALLSLLLAILAVAGLWRTPEMAQTLQVVASQQGGSFDASN